MKALRLLLFLLATPAYGSTIYFAPTAAGSNNGTSCANAYAWTDGTHGINVTTQQASGGNGNTLWLCPGTYTGSANGSGIVIGTSGSSSNPIIIQFDPGGVTLQSTYWGSSNLGGGCGGPPCPAGISVPGYNYVIIDGGNAGVLQNTANGTSKANQQPSIGIDLYGSNLIIRNLTVQNIYNQGYNTADSAGANTYGIRAAGGSTNVSICNNTVKSARYGIALGADGSTSNTPNLNCQSNSFTTGVDIFLNTVDDACWMIQLGEAYGGSPSAVNIYANSIGPVTGGYNWQAPSGSYHPNGIVAFTPTSGGTSVVVWIWNNYIGDDLGDLPGNQGTGQVFCAPGTSSTASAECKIFNNVFYDPGAINGEGGHAPYAAGGAASSSLITGTYFLNNTFVHVSGVFFTYGGVDHVNVTMANNIESLGAPGLPSTQAGFFTNQDGTLYADEVVNWADNIYWPVTGGATTCGASAGANGCVWLWNSATPYTTLASWQSYSGSDTGSQQTDPKLNANYTLGSGSPGIGQGTNFTSLCGSTFPSALCYDKPLTVGVGGTILGNPRPSSGAWDIGAYNNTGTPTVATPVISPASGAYTSPQTVTITTSTGGASIYYTTNGTTPTCSSTLYTGGFSQTVPGTVEAIGCLSGYINSAIATANYVLPGPPGTTINNGPTVNNGTGITQVPPDPPTNLRVVAVY